MHGKSSKKGFGDLGWGDWGLGDWGGVNFTSFRGRVENWAVTKPLVRAISMHLPLFSSSVRRVVFMKTGVGAWKMLEKGVW